MPTCILELNISVGFINIVNMGPRSSTKRIPDTAQLANLVYLIVVV